MIHFRKIDKQNKVGTSLGEKRNCCYYFTINYLLETRKLCELFYLLSLLRIFSKEVART